MYVAYRSERPRPSIARGNQPAEEFRSLEYPGESIEWVLRGSRPKASPPEGSWIRHVLTWLGFARNAPRARDE